MESKFCPNCGAGINPNGGLYCGKQVEKKNSSVTQIKAPGNNKTLIMGVAVVVVILAVILGVVVFSHPKNALIGKWEAEDGVEWEFFRNGTVKINDGFFTNSGSYSFADRKHITIKDLGLLSLFGTQTLAIEIKGDEMTLGDY